MDYGSNLGYLLKAFWPTGSLNFFMELFFLDIFNSTLSALGAATFPNSIPVQCIKNFLDSTIINEEIKYPSLNQFLEPCCCCIGKTFQCWHIPSPVLFSTRVFSTVSPSLLVTMLTIYPLHLLQLICSIAVVISFPQLGEVCPEMRTKDSLYHHLNILWLEGSSSPSGELSYSWLWISYKLYSIIPSQEDKKKGEWKKLVIVSPDSDKCKDWNARDVITSNW